MEHDLVIIGLGSGGMTAASFAATLGLRVAVVERDRIGGDCLWTGCVPSKALLASARAAHTIRHADRYGLAAREPDIDTAAVWDRLRAVRQRIADTDDNAERFSAMGVEVIRGDATVTGPQEVTVDVTRRLSTRVILVCTGSRPRTPSIPGLDEAGFLTNESVFELASAPPSVVVIGGGPVGVELGQALQRLGLRTSLLQRGPTLLTRDEPSLVATLHERLAAEGVQVRVGVDIERVTVDADGTKVVHAARSTWRGAELLVAVGRVPNVDGLGLDAIGVEVGSDGVVVDERQRTAVRSVYAAGDVTGRYLFTHAAGYDAVRAVRDAFFPGRARPVGVMPWCTFTDPELAHAGLTSHEARARYGDDARVWRFDLEHNDRARSDGADDGAVVVVTGPKRRIVGAHVLAPAAGEMIHELALAMRERLGLAQLASLVHVYPTTSTAIGQLAADAAYEGAQRFRWLLKRR